MDRDLMRDAESLYLFLSDCPGPTESADFILAAGSHDLRVPEHAAKLYRKGLAPLIVCSGGLGKVTDGLFREPEAILFARRCIACGVPEDRILTETESTNTGENIRFTRRILREKGLYPRSGILVSKPYMARRVFATAYRQWEGVTWSVDTPDIPFGEYAADEDALRLETELMVGDLQRLKVYAACGFQIPMEVPDNIWEAYERLVAAGYDRYVLRDTQEQKI